MKLGALAAGPAVLLAARIAAAQDIPRELRLDVAGDTCVTVEGLREALAVALGVDPVRPTATARLRVHVLAGSSLSRGRWEVLDGQGAKVRQRTITVTGGCSMLVRDLALSIAVAYETSAPPDPAPPPAVGCDAACRARIRAEVRADLLAEGYRPAMDFNVAVMAGGLLSLGYTADPGPGAWLAGELRYGDAFSVAAEARVLFPSRAVPSAGDPFDVTAVTLAVVPCYRWRVLLGCTVADIGFLALAGVTSPTGEPILATFGVGPRIAVQVPFGERFGLRLFSDLRFAPVPTRARFIDTGGTWESNLVSGLFGVGLSFE